MTTWLTRKMGPDGPSLCLCLTPKALVKALSHMKGLSPGSAEFPKTGAITYTFSGSGSEDVCCIVAFSEEAQAAEDPTDTVGLLVHEAVHVAQAYFRHAVNDKVPSDEAMAYAVQLTACRLMRDYSKQTNRKKPRAKSKSRKP